MFASVPLCLLPPPTKSRIYPPPRPGSGYILGYTPPRPRTAHTPHPPRIPHPARHALRAPRAPRVPSASCPTNARPSFSFLSPNKNKIYPPPLPGSGYLLGYMPIFLPPSPFPPRRGLPNPAPRFAHLPICTRSLHTSSAPRTPSAFLSGLAAHPHPSIPHPSHPVLTPAYLLGYIPPHIRLSPSSSSLYVYRRSYPAPLATSETARQSR